MSAPATVLSERLRRHAVSVRTAGTPRIPFAHLARLVGVSRRTVYYALNAHVSPANEILLSKTLDMIESGTLKFERRKQLWTAVGSLPLIIRPRRRPYTRRPGKALSLTREGLVRKLRELAQNEREIERISIAVALPYQVVRQAVSGAMSANTFEALVTLFNAEVR